MSGSCSRKMSIPDSAAQRMKRRTRSALGRPRADQERAAQRHHERRPRGAAAVQADPLPRALDAAHDGLAEAAAAGHLERVVADLVQLRSELEQPAGRDAPGERLLPQQAERRVDESGHGVTSGARDVAAFARVDLDPVAHVDEQRHLHVRARLERRGLVTFETVSPLTPGSVSVTSSSTDAGSCTAAGVPSTDDQLHRVADLHAGQLLGHLHLGERAPARRSRRPSGRCRRRPRTGTGRRRSS